MNRLFGAKKQEPLPPPPPPPQDPKPTTATPATIPLADQQARLEHKVRELSQTCTKLDNEAKALYELAKKSKGSARDMYKQKTVAVMRNKKQHEAQLKMYMNQQYTLNQVAFTSESIRTNLEMGQAMKEVVQQQKLIMKDLDFDELDKARDQMEELKQESSYMNEMLQRNYDQDYDQNDLEEEFGNLVREIKAEKNKERQSNKPFTG